MGPPPSETAEKNKLAKPTSLKEVPSYLIKTVGSFFSRLFYIFRLVWQTRPWILFVMMFMTLYDGIAPVVHSLIHAALLNALADAIVNKSLDGFYFYLALQFGYLIVNSVVKNIHNILNRISGELVSNKIKVAIIEKSKEVDLASFDNPEFYERLENANREAGNRPIHILQSLFSILSTTF